MRYHMFLAAVAAIAVAGPAAAQSVEEARPAVPQGFAASFTSPDRDVTGAYRTPNAGLSSAEVTWHVRVALNVAALGCGGADAATMPTAYNALLSAEKAPLADANTAAEQGERRRWGVNWQAHHDFDQTKLYNFWAQPPAQAGFCAVARAVLAEAASVRPEEFAGFAAAALPRLEAPFVAAFARWDAYRAAVAAWDASHAPVLPTAPAPVVLAAAADVAPAPVLSAAAPVAAVPVVLAAATPPLAPPSAPAVAAPVVPATAVIVEASAPSTPAAPALPLTSVATSAPPALPAAVALASPRPAVLALLPQH